VQKEYERVKAQAGDKEYRARHILVETEDQAKGMIAELKKGGKFDELASKNSKDGGTAQRGGDLDWNVPSAFDKAFSDAMVKLDKGKFSDAPVRTRFGYHVILLDDVRPVKFPPLADIRPRIQQQMVQAKLEELVKSLRAKAKVE
jgi:peptidyl-prolyl cis-trans isomerase C